MKRFPDALLRKLRNEVPITPLLAQLNWPHKWRDGQLICVCPICGESRTDLNPQENLLRCFLCERNFNPIDFTMAAKECRFVDAVHCLLELGSTTQAPQ